MLSIARLLHKTKFYVVIVKIQHDTLQYDTSTLCWHSISRTNFDSEHNSNWRLKHPTLALYIQGTLDDVTNSDFHFNETIDFPQSQQRIAYNHRGNVLTYFKWQLEIW